MVRTILISTFVLLLWNPGSSQMVMTDTSYAIEELVDKVLLGKGVRAGNFEFHGGKFGYGAFMMDSSLLGMKEGMLLTTGKVKDAFGKNTTQSMSGVHPMTGRRRRGIASAEEMDLIRLAKGKTYDALIIEFDFVPFDNRIEFNFCFGSEEYPEYVGSQFNDVFAFYVSGPGMKKRNLAVLPKDGAPITVNSVNERMNSEFYRDNPPATRRRRRRQTPQDELLYGRTREQQRRKHPNEVMKAQALREARQKNLQFDGFTTILTAHFFAEPYKKYHFKIAIADVSDQKYDSGVFLEKGSFSASKDTTQPGFQDYADLRERIDIDSILANRMKPDKSSKETLTPQEEFEKFRITNIHFDTDKALIPDSARKDLDRLARYLKDHNRFTCTLEGYTDIRGGKEYNQRLSERRAKAVMQYLTQHGVAARRLNYKGNNFQDPLGDNATRKGRARNRRVEIEIHRNE